METKNYPPGIEPSLLIDVILPPVYLWDHALQHRTWRSKVDGKTSDYAVDGNSSTFAKTSSAKYPLLAVDLSRVLKIDYVVINIKEGKLCT